MIYARDGKTIPRRVPRFCPSLMSRSEGSRFDIFLSNRRQAINYDCA
jgi:hypothetical protein